MLSNKNETNEGKTDIDKLLKELENEAVPEESSIIIEKQIQRANDEKKPDKKPEWADKKNDDYNTYDYSDDKDVVDEDW